MSGMHERHAREACRLSRSDQRRATPALPAPTIAAAMQLPCACERCTTRLTVCPSVATRASELADSRSPDDAGLLARFVAFAPSALSPEMTEKKLHLFRMQKI